MMSDINSKNTHAENADRENINQVKTGQEETSPDNSGLDHSGLEHTDLNKSGLDSSDLNNSDNENQMPSKPPGIFSVIQSVFAAMIGIQSQDKHKQDFEQGYAGSYIVVGIIMVALFIFGLIEYVDYVLEKAGQK
jgi:hypothetical protein